HGSRRSAAHGPVRLPRANCSTSATPLEAIQGGAGGVMGEGTLPAPEGTTASPHRDGDVVVHPDPGFHPGDRIDLSWLWDPRYRAEALERTAGSFRYRRSAGSGIGSGSSGT